MPAEMPIVAWMDDGQQAANGTDGTALRVVTETTKASMPNSVVAPYTDPLVRLSDALSYAATVRAEMVEDVILAYSGALKACGVTSGDREELTKVVRSLIDKEAGNG